ncbi:hypothetical protein FSP39_000009 [Pinctada imbricata]|uniref:ADAMTS-like protein 3 n=1 Tax=Pinctada imbricata TaxID=66713 RepID=A0AA88Y259_PINIB|nr:hypothetical protein FSP39_000009 [Pinctada imbricata]
MLNTQNPEKNQHSALVRIVVHTQTVLGSYWSPWSPWSACSRSCDGGLSNQKRSCFDRRRNCLGPNIRYRFCNTLPCVGEYKDISYSTCKLHNDKWSYNDQSNWIPVSDQHYPCHAICKDESGNFPNEIRANMEDGIMCGSNENFYCLAGKCARLGCDGLAWSNTVIDGCGICGAKNSTCANNKRQRSRQRRYNWIVKWQPCSVTCGTGFQLSKAVCLDNLTGKEMSNEYRCYSRKPEPVYRECRRQTCGPRWQVSEYGSCSAECGGGIQRRRISCVMAADRSRIIKVSPYRLSGSHSYVRKALQYEILSSVLGVRTMVSVPDLQQYDLVLVWIATELESQWKPQIVEDNSTYYQVKRMKRVNLRVGTSAILLPRQPVKIKCTVTNFDKKMIFWTRNNRLISMSTNARVHVNHKGVLKIKRTDPDLDKGEFTCIAGLAKASIHLKFQNKKFATKAAKKMMKHMTGMNDVDNFINKPQSDKAPGAGGPMNSISVARVLNEHSERKTFMTSDWTECSKTCGTGIQTRNVSCSIVSTGFIKVVDDSECLKDKLYKPPLHRKCVIWKHCPYLHIGEWTMCSTDRCKKEGIATQTRNIYCVSGNSTKLPISDCRSTNIPSSERECPNEKCVAQWKVLKWTKCSPKCSPRGKRTRILTCVWAKTGEFASDNCRIKPRPVLWKSCKPKCKKGCRDTSRYCSLVGMLKMCRYNAFTTRCCRTCRSVNQIPN